MLSPIERLNWRIVSTYRKWRYFVLIQVVVATWLLWPSRFPGGLTGLNLILSWMAIVIEQMVGIVLLAQMFRDAVILRTEFRDIREALQEIKAVHAQNSEILFELHKLVVLPLEEGHRAGGKDELPDTAGCESCAQPESG